MIKYPKGSATGPGYDEFPVGTVVRLKADHMFEGKRVPTSAHRQGAIGEVVPCADERNFSRPHVVVRLGARRKWFDIDCLEFFENGPSEEEIAALFGIKTDAEALMDVMLRADENLSAETAQALAKAIIASPVWRHA